MQQMERNEFCPAMGPPRTTGKPIHVQSVFQISWGHLQVAQVLLLEKEVMSLRSEGIYEEVSPFLFKVEVWIIALPPL